MKKAKVLFEYEPQEDDELTLKVGEIITDVENADVGWCSGILNGKRGMFPDNFVEMFEEEEKKPPAPPSANKKPSKKKVRKMKVTYAYEADNVDELTLEVGDIIEIIKDVEDGWAEGMNKKGKTGVFPTNFGETYEEQDDSDPVVAKAEDVENEESPSSHKKVKGVGFGNIFSDGPIKLRQRSVKDSDKKSTVTSPTSKTAIKETPPAKSKESTPSKVKDVPPAVTKESSLPKVTETKTKKPGNYCRVTFDYERDNDDELTLSKGEVIRILDKNLADEGWWEGEKVDAGGKKWKGVFPDNFVVELTPEEAREHEKQLQPKTEPDRPKESKALKPPKESIKKAPSSAPMLPPQSAKPTIQLEDDPSSDTSFTDTASTNHTLSQIKRPGGPKNRRKPGASERREKAASSFTEDPLVEEIESEEETKVEKTPEPPKKKESVKRGVAVLPGLGGGGGDASSTQPPSWLQNLKNRQSVRKVPVSTPPKEEPPAWLTNLKKRQSTDSTSPAQPKAPPQPKVDSPKSEKPATEPLPSSKPTTKPTPTQQPTTPTEKPLAAWQIERQQKAQKAKSDTNELQQKFGSFRRRKEKAPEPPEQPEKAPEPSWKNSLTRKVNPPTTKPQNESAPPTMKKPDKPPIGTPVAMPSSFKQKPAPPRSKPAPPSKPASSAAVEELKSEVKSMKEEMAKMREEFKKEISLLNSELQAETNHRMTLEDEVRKLRLKMPS